MDADLSRQALGGAPTGGQTVVGVLVSYAGLLGGNDHVTGQHQLQTPREGVALYDGDCRQGEVASSRNRRWLVDEAYPEGIDLLNEAGQPGVVVESILKSVQVRTRAEGSPLPSDHQRLDLTSRLHLAHRVGQLLHHPSGG